MQSPSALGETARQGGAFTAAAEPNTSGRRSFRRLMFASQKGGVGKTASAVNVALALGESSYKVLIVDTDPNGAVAACFGTTLPPGHPGVYGMSQWGIDDLVIPELAPNVDLLPYAEDRRAVDLNSLHTSMDILSEQAQSIYDFMIVDTRPSVADMTRRLCQVVDEVVVVFQCHPLAYRTLGGVLGQLRDARADGASARLLGLLLTMVDRRDPLAVQLEAHIRRSLGQALFPVSIPHDPLVAEGLMVDRPIVQYLPDSTVARAYRDLTHVLVNTPQPAG